MTAATELAGDSKDLNDSELSVLFSNLAKGCEKQYRPEEATLFKQLAEYYQGKTGPVEPWQLSDLSAVIQQDLDTRYAAANGIASGQKDPGALRAMAWSEKVTRIHHRPGDRPDDPFPSGDLGITGLEGTTASKDPGGGRSLPQTVR